MSRKIIIDCDNTFSVSGCDIDDGLAIIYALAQEDTEILGICTTFGNNELDIVFPNTVRFMKDIGCENIPVYRGTTDSCADNEAAKFLVDMANTYEGELSLIGLGSLTNLYHAWQLDHTFYNKINAISLMGGITEPLIINNTSLRELNFSIHYQAALHVLQHANKLIIATGNTCLDGFFTRGRFDKLKEGSKFEGWLYEQAIYWFEGVEKVFHSKGIYLWDILAVAALLNPELFQNNRVDISPDKVSIKNGMLIGHGNTRSVVIPKIRNVDNYIEHIYLSFNKFGEIYK